MEKVFKCSIYLVKGYSLRVESSDDKNEFQLPIDTKHSKNLDRLLFYLEFRHKSVVLRDWLGVLSSELVCKVALFFGCVDKGSII